jgi:hypothetical protein
MHWTREHIGAVEAAGRAAYEDRILCAAGKRCEIIVVPRDAEEMPERRDFHERLRLLRGGLSPAQRGR